jgi:hypothetical protein
MRFMKRKWTLHEEKSLDASFTIVPALLSPFGYNQPKFQSSRKRLNATLTRVLVYSQIVPYGGRPRNAKAEKISQISNVKQQDGKSNQIAKDFVRHGDAWRLEVPRHKTPMIVSVASPLSHININPG